MITGNLWFRQPFEAYKQQFILKMMARQLIPPPTVIDSGVVLKAYVNHGRWQVKCECGGAEFTWEEGLVMCMSCLNGRHKHQWRRSEFPAERQEIERLLIMRPLDNRNWFQNESLDDLRRENEQHKAELLGGGG